MSKRSRSISERIDEWLTIEPNMLLQLAQETATDAIDTFAAATSVHSQANQRLFAIANELDQSRSSPLTAQQQQFSPGSTRRWSEPLHTLSVQTTRESKPQKHFIALCHSAYQAGIVLWNACADNTPFPFRQTSLMLLSAALPPSLSSRGQLDRRLQLCEAMVVGIRILLSSEPPNSPSITNDENIAWVFERVQRSGILVRPNASTMLPLVVERSAAATDSLLAELVRLLGSTITISSDLNENWLETTEQRFKFLTYSIVQCLGHGGFPSSALPQLRSVQNVSAIASNVSSCENLLLTKSLVAPLDLLCSAFAVPEAVRTLSYTPPPLAVEMLGESLARLQLSLGDSAAALGTARRASSAYQLACDITGTNTDHYSQPSSSSSYRLICLIAEIEAHLGSFEEALKTLNALHAELLLERVKEVERWMLSLARILTTGADHSSLRQEVIRQVSHACRTAEARRRTTTGSMTVSSHCILLSARCLFTLKQEQLLLSFNPVSVSSLQTLSNEPLFEQVNHVTTLVTELVAAINASPEHSQQEVLSFLRATIIALWNTAQTLRHPNKCTQEESFNSPSNPLWIQAACTLLDASVSLAAVSPDLLSSSNRSRLSLARAAAHVHHCSLRDTNLVSSQAAALMTLHAAQEAWTCRASLSSCLILLEAQLLFAVTQKDSLKPEELEETLGALVRLAETQQVFPALLFSLKTVQKVAGTEKLVSTVAYRLLHLLLEAPFHLQHDCVSLEVNCCSEDCVRRVLISRLASLCFALDHADVSKHCWLAQRVSTVFQEALCGSTECEALQAEQLTWERQRLSACDVIVKQIIALDVTQQHEQVEKERARLLQYGITLSCLCSETPETLERMFWFRMELLMCVPPGDILEHSQALLHLCHKTLGDLGLSSETISLAKVQGQLLWECGRLFHPNPFDLSLAPMMLTDISSDSQQCPANAIRYLLRRVDQLIRLSNEERCCSGADGLSIVSKLCSSVRSILQQLMESQWTLIASEGTLVNPESLQILLGDVLSALNAFVTTRSEWMDWFVQVVVPTVERASTLQLGGKLDNSHIRWLLQTALSTASNLTGCLRATLVREIARLKPFVEQVDTESSSVLKALQ